MKYRVLTCLLATVLVWPIVGAQRASEEIRSGNVKSRKMELTVEAFLSYVRAG